MGGFGGSNDGGSSNSEHVVTCVTWAASEQEAFIGKSGANIKKLMRVIGGGCNINVDTQSGRITLQHCDNVQRAEKLIKAYFLACKMCSMPVSEVSEVVLVVASILL